jgi:hypothetical protein
MGAVREFRVRWLSLYWGLAVAYGVADGPV